MTRKDYVDEKTGAASETVSGIIELATTAEAQAGTDDLRALTPLKLRNALNASGTAPIYACRAWVNFNGTGTVAIRASGNVSSVTDNGVGDYIFNLITAMPDANYSISGTAFGAGQAGFIGDTLANVITSLFSFNTYNFNGTLIDFDTISVSITR